MDDRNYQKTFSSQDGNRRALLVRWVQWTLAATAALFLYPLFRFAGFKPPRRPRLVDVPAPLPASGTHASQDFLLFATEDGGAKAVSRICTHLGCRVNYLQDKEYIECPCHQSRFTAEGVRISGPAERNLPTFTVTQKVDSEGQVTAYVVHL
jgi:cytochrome b6-f complex iron-sulfur subunit